MPAETKRVKVPKVLRTKSLRLDPDMLSLVYSQNDLDFLAQTASYLLTFYGPPCPDFGGCLKCRLWTGFYGLANTLLAP